MMAGGAIVLNNQAKTSGSAKGCGVGFTLDKENHLTVRGCVGVGQWAVQQRMAIKNPLMYAQGMIKSQLAKAEHCNLMVKFNWAKHHQVLY